MEEIGIDKEGLLVKWYIGYNGNDDLILDNSQINPQYYLCKRYYPTHPNEKLWFGEFIKEIVSVDIALFPEEEQIVLSEEQARNIVVEEENQVLRVFCMLDEKGNIDNPYIADQKINEFDFCGFDLADGWVSAILNCGSFASCDYFSKAFDYQELNELGLISNYESAVQIRQKLMDEYPDDEHTYCAIFAIWRRIMKND